MLQVVLPFKVSSTLGGENLLQEEQILYLVFILCDRGGKMREFLLLFVCPRTPQSDDFTEMVIVRMSGLTTVTLCMT